jgi:hypothetical protein
LSSVVDISNSALPAGTVEAALARLFPAPDPYLDEPVLWIKERLKEWPWSKQREIAESVKDNRYTAVKACHGPGKSFIAARIACWWLAVHELGSAFVVTTAPSWPQVQAILWREIRRAHRKADLPGRITLECLWYQGEGRRDEELIAMGRKPQDYDEQAFQGIHARYVLIILDEACAIPTALWNAMKTLMSNEYARVLAIGNPDDPSSEFATVCNPGTDWNVISISAFDTPNFTGEEIPEEYQYILQDLTSPIWVDERRKDWGEGSAIWTSKVEGEFPDVSDDFLITPAMLQRSYDTNLPGLAHGRYGADIARLGEDKTVIYRNRGGHIRLQEQWAKLDTMQTADRIAQILLSHGALVIPAVIDAIGVGAGVFDRLRQRGFEVGAFEGSTRALRFNKFNNRRSEIYWTFRTMMENGEIDLDPGDDQLAAELTNIKWWLDSSGRIVIEPKDDMRERGVMSPNHADAAVLSTVSIGNWGSLGHDERDLTGDLLTKAM